MKQISPYRFLIILCLSIIGYNGFSQNLKKANKLYANRSYVKAAEIYNKLPRTNEVMKKLGDCYYFNSEIKKANDLYSEVFDNSDKSELSQDFYFKFYDVLKSSENYEKADLIANNHLGLNRNTETFKVILRQVIPFTYNLELLTGDNQSMNFGTGLKGDEIVFASTRNPKGRAYSWNNKPYLNLFSANVTGDIKKSISNVTELPEPLNKIGLHESSAVFTKDGNTIYFSRNHRERVQIDSNKVAMVSIYRATKKNGKWSNAKRVDFANDYYSTMHPALNENEDKLFFASDMPGSLGSYDIYYVDIISNGNFGEPVNMGGKINTKYREQFPFIAQDSTIYFSSNGKQGFGGLDVFSSAHRDYEYAEALNLGESLNGPEDEFAFVMVDSINNGYLSSNRDGVDNIYFVARTPTVRNYRIQGIVTDKVSGDILPNTVVSLFDKNGNVLDQMVTGEDGRYVFKTMPNKKYQLEGFLPTYIPTIENFDTNDRGDIRFDIELEILSYDDAEEIVVGRDDGFVYVELENIYFDFARWEIKPQAAETLDVLVALLKKYPRMEIDLSAHTDSRATPETNLILSQKRAESTLEYLVSNGIARTRLKSKGYGESKPLINCGSNCTESEHAINRRVEFVISK
ncbi:MAG: OmpA family protein [Bacteroidota bacterium]